MNLGLTLRTPVLRRATWLAALAGSAVAFSVISDPAPATTSSTVPESERAKVSSKDGSATPVRSKGPELDEQFLLPGRNSSGAPGIDIPPPSNLNQKQQLDPKARKRMMEELDRRRNWMFDDKSNGSAVTDRAKAKAAQGTKGSDSKNIEFESSRQRTLLEKRMAGDDEESRAEKAEKEEREAKGRKKSDDKAAGRDDLDRDRDLDPDSRTERDSKKSSATSADRDNRPFQQAVFSDPFSPPRIDGDDSSRSGGSGSVSGKSASESGATPGRPSSERIDSLLNGPGASAPSASRTDLSAIGGFGAPKTTHSQQFNELLLGNGNDSGASRPGLLDASKAPSATRAFGTGAGSPFGGSVGSPGLVQPTGSVFSTPAAPRPSTPMVKPQPGVLPFPSRNF